MATTARLIHQLDELRLRYGDCAARTVCHATGSDWPKPPALHIKRRWHRKAGGATYQRWVTLVEVWSDAEGAPGVDPLQLLEGLSAELVRLLKGRIDQLPNELHWWARQQPTHSLGRWVWFLAGLNSMPIPGRLPRTKRMCWTTKGHTFPADQLEVARHYMPEAFTGELPPDDNCWMVELQHVLQLSIDAVEYLDGLQVAAAAEAKAEAGPEALAVNPKPTLRTLKSKRHKRIVELAKEHQLENQWAQLLERCQEDDQMKWLTGEIKDKLTKDIVRYPFRQQHSRKRRK